jgi:hypothetical protein
VSAIKQYATIAALNMMKMRLILVAVSIAGSSACNRQAPVLSRQRPLRTTCLVADAYTARQIDALKSVMASSDSNTLRFRLNVHLPTVPDTAIQVVSDPTKCAAALTTYNATSDSVRVTALYLIRVGNVYVGSTADTTREWTEQIVMDSMFAYVGTYLR